MVKAWWPCQFSSLFSCQAVASYFLVRHSCPPDKIEKRAQMLFGMEGGLGRCKRQREQMRCLRWEEGRGQKMTALSVNFRAMWKSLATGSEAAGTDAEFLMQRHVGPTGDQFRSRRKESFLASSPARRLLGLGPSAPCSPCRSPSCL